MSFAHKMIIMICLILIWGSQAKSMDKTSEVCVQGTYKKLDSVLIDRQNDLPSEVSFYAQLNPLFYAPTECRRSEVMSVVIFDDSEKKQLGEFAANLLVKWWQSSLYDSLGNQVELAPYPPLNVFIKSERENQKDDITFTLSEDGLPISVNIHYPNNKNFLFNKIVWDQKTMSPAIVDLQRGKISELNQSSLIDGPKVLKAIKAMEAFYRFYDTAFKFQKKINAQVAFLKTASSPSMIDIEIMIHRMESIISISDRLTESQEMTQDGKNQYNWYVQGQKTLRKDYNDPRTSCFKNYYKEISSLDIGKNMKFMAQAMTSDQMTQLDAIHGYECLKAISVYFLLLDSDKYSAELNIVDDFINDVKRKWSKTSVYKELQKSSDFETAYIYLSSSRSHVNKASILYQIDKQEGVLEAINVYYPDKGYFSVSPDYSVLKAMKSQTLQALDQYYRFKQAVTILESKTGLKLKLPLDHEISGSDLRTVYDIITDLSQTLFTIDEFTWFFKY